MTSEQRKEQTIICYATPAIKKKVVEYVNKSEGAITVSKFTEDALRKYLKDIGELPANKG
jgi:hypothetical protein